MNAPRPALLEVETRPIPLSIFETDPEPKPELAAGRIALRETAETPAERHPRSAEERARYWRSRSVGGDTPRGVYGELGGGLAVDDDLQGNTLQMIEKDIFDEAYQPWMRDIVHGAEQLGIFEMTAARANLLPAAERKSYELTLYQYAAYLMNSIRTMTIPGNEYADHIVKRYGERSPQELRIAQEKLKQLRLHMQESGLWALSGIDVPHVGYEKARHDQAVRHNHEKGKFQLVFGADGSAHVRHGANE